MTQPDKSSLEIAKLQAEIKKLKWEASWLGRLSPFLAAAVAIGGLAIGMSNFASQQQANREAAMDAQTRQFKERFWQERLKVYIQATTAASKIANMPAIESAAASHFRELYWGEMSILEDQEVVNAMVRFESALSKVEAGEADIAALRNHSYSLARACRRSLRNTWEPFPLDDVRDPEFIETGGGNAPTTEGGERLELREGTGKKTH